MLSFDDAKVVKIIHFVNFYCIFFIVEASESVFVLQRERKIRFSSRHDRRAPGLHGQSRVTLKINEIQ